MWKVRYMWDNESCCREQDGGTHVKQGPVTQAVNAASREH